MTREFLSSILGADANGNLPGVAIVAELIQRRDPQTGELNKGFRHYHVETVAHAVQTAKTISERGADAYVALAQYKTFNPKPKARNRTKENAAGARSFWLDIDCGPGKPYADQAAGLRALMDFCKVAGLPKPTYIVNSGNGLHVYWRFDEFIPSAKWIDRARKLKCLAEKQGFDADPARSADIASILRVPGTKNFKDPANPKPVNVFYAGATVDLAAFTRLLDTVTPEEERMRGAANGKRLEAPRGRPGANLIKSSLPETQESIGRIKSMLAVIPPDIGRPEWRQICWAAMATGLLSAPQLIRDWSERGEKFTETDFANVVRDFNSGGGTGFGTLVYYARQYGWLDAALMERSDIIGSSGDVQNGKLFAAMCSFKLLHIDETGGWLLFDPLHGWLAAPPREEERAAKDVLSAIRHYAAEQWKADPEAPRTKQLMKHLGRTSQAPQIRAMIDMAKSEPGMTVRLSEFDNDPMLLGVANGVLHLRKGVLLSASPDVLVSKRCNVVYDPDADCPRFEQFIWEVQPDPDVRAFLQRLVGYCLTGQVNEQMFAFLYGQGANGKSVFIEIIAWLLGDYARKVATELLMQHQRSPQSPSPDIVSLKGMRFIFANETEEGRRLAEARVKEMTGGDTLTGRVPYGRADISFQPTHKLLIAGNHKPEITDASFGMWRRVILVPFDQTIPEAGRDPKLLERLKSEGAGILNWALAGLRNFQANGLQIPKVIKASTAAYRDELDILGEWLSERCATGPTCKEAKMTLYNDYIAWTSVNGHKPLAQGRLTRRLNERGYRLAPDKRTVQGLSLKPKGAAPRTS